MPGRSGTKLINVCTYAADDEWWWWWWCGWWLCSLYQWTLRWTWWQSAVLMSAPLRRCYVNSPTSMIVSFQHPPVDRSLSKHTSSQPFLPIFIYHQLIQTDTSRIIHCAVLDCNNFSWLKNAYSRPFLEKLSEFRTSKRKLLQCYRYF